MSILAVLAGDAGWHVECGDALEVLQTIARVDHVFTDPPYEAEAHTKQRRLLRGGARLIEEAPVAFDAISNDVRQRAGAEIARICRRWALVFCQSEAAVLWKAALEPLNYKRTCVWIKPDGMPQLTGDRPGLGYESFVCAHSRGRSRWNGGGRVGVFTHNKADIGPKYGRNEHPTQKPISLMVELIELFTDPGDVVLDPFAGSGTTGVAALRIGRRAILIEKDPTYAALARERLLAEETQSTLSAARSGQLPLLGRAQ